MEIVSVKANKNSDVEVDDEGGKYPFRSDICIYVASSYVMICERICMYVALS